MMSSSFAQNLIRHDRSAHLSRYKEYNRIKLASYPDAGTRVSLVKILHVNRLGRLII